MLEGRIGGGQWSSIVEQCSWRHHSIGHPLLTLALSNGWFDEVGVVNYRGNVA
jgi:hypothetical protein